MVRLFGLIQNNLFGNGGIYATIKHEYIINGSLLPLVPRGYANRRVDVDRKPAADAD